MTKTINFHKVHQYQSIWRGYTDSIPTTPLNKEETNWEKNHNNFRKFFHIQRQSDGRYYVEEVLAYDFLLRVTIKHSWRNYTDNIKVDNFSFDSLEELLGFFRMNDIELKGVIE